MAGQKTDTQLFLERYRYLQLASMVYVAIMLVTIVMTDKVSTIFHHPISAATLLIPVWYAMSDVITEVYGYRVARRLIWYGLLCQLIFVSSCYLLVHVTTSALDIQHAYAHIFDTLPRITFASLVASLTGNFLNIYFLSKWKILTKGRMFWLRSVASSAIGMALFTLIGGLIVFAGRLPLSTILWLVIGALLYKILLDPLCTTLASIVSAQLKRIENIDSYDYDVSYNPFKIG